MSWSSWSKERVCSAMLSKDPSESEQAGWKLSMKIGLAFILVGNLLWGSCCLPIREPGRLAELFPHLLGTWGRGIEQVELVNHHHDNHHHRHHYHQHHCYDKGHIMMMRMIVEERIEQVALVKQRPTM